MCLNIRFETLTKLLVNSLSVATLLKCVSIKIYLNNLKKFQNLLIAGEFLALKVKCILIELVILNLILIYSHIRNF